jgi:uncharacterized RDD family membrane protein YckC
MAWPSPPPQGSSLSELDHLARDRHAQEYWLYRALAFTIDAVIVGIGLTILAFLVTLAAGHPTVAPLFEINVLPSPSAIGAGVVLFIYFLLAETAYGSTFGKEIMHLRVVNVDGTRPDPFKIAIRNISKIYFVLLILDILAGLLSHSRRGQKFSDYIVGTNVITTNQEIGFLKFRSRTQTQT